MPSRPPSPAPWSHPLVRTMLLTVLATELVAFYILCAHQVQKAQARRSVSQVHLQAFSDCLVYVTGSTIASCGRQMLARPQAN